MSRSMSESAGRQAGRTEPAQQAGFGWRRAVLAAAVVAVCALTAGRVRVLGQELKVCGPDCEPCKKCSMGEFEKRGADNSNAMNPKSGSATAPGDVEFATGAETQSAVDLRIPGLGVDFVLGRTYRGRHSPFTEGTILGSRWTLTYVNDILQVNSGSITVKSPNGRNDTYTDVFFTGDYTNDAGFYDVIHDNGDNSYTRTYRDGGTDLYDGFGELTRRQDRFGNGMDFTYDNGFRITRVTDTLARNIDLVYDTHLNLLTRVNDFNGRFVEYKYSSAAMLTKVTSACGCGATQTTSYLYDSSRRMTRAVDGNGQVVNQFVYDASDRVTREIRGASGQIWDYVRTTYPVVTVTQANDPSNTVRKFYYDSTTNRLTRRETLAPDTSVLSYESYLYSSVGELTRTSRPAGNDDVMLYDDAGNVTFRSGPAVGGGQSESMEYDTFSAFNSLTRRTDGNGNVTSYYYDGLGLLTQTVLPATSTVGGGSQTPTINYLYNSYGQLTQMTDAEGVVTDYAYYSSGDQNGYLQTVTVDSGGLALATTYTYDKVGNITRVADPRGFATSLYLNSFNKATKVVDALGQEVRFEYDGNFNVTRRLVQETGALGDGFAETRYYYDLLNKLTRTDEETVAGTFRTTSYAYDNNENLTRLTRPEGNVVDYAYEVRNVLSSMTVGGSATTVHAYDGSGRRTRIADPNGNASTLVYDAYDRLTRLVRADSGYTEMAYDASGNLTQMVGRSAGGTALSESWLAYDALDRLTQRRAKIAPGGAADDNADGFAEYVYDSNSRLTKGRTRLSNSGPVVAQTILAYDGPGRLTRSTDPEGNASSFFYDAGGLLTRTSNAASEVTSAYYDELGRLACRPVRWRGRPV